MADVVEPEPLLALRGACDGRQGVGVNRRAAPGGGDRCEAQALDAVTQPGWQRLLELGQSPAGRSPQLP